MPSAAASDAEDVSAVLILVAIDTTGGAQLQVVLDVFEEGKQAVSERDALTLTEPRFDHNLTVFRPVFPYQ